MQNPYDAIGGKTWIKGMQLGMLVLVLFIGGAIVAFFFLSLLGLGAANSLIAAAILGPVIGTGAFICWHLFRNKPSIEE